MARTRCCPAPAPKSSKYLLLLPGRRMRRRRLTHRIHHNPYMDCTCRSTIPPMRPMWKKKTKKKKKTGGRTVLEQAATSEQGPGLGSGSGFRLSISHQGSQNRHNRDRDVASIGLSGGTLSLSQYRQYRLGSLTRDTIPLTDDIVTLSHSGYVPVPRR